MSSLSDQPPDGGLAAWGNVGAAFFVMAHTPAMHYIYGLVFVEWLEAFPGSSRAAVAGCGSLSTGVMLGAAYASGSLQARGLAPGRVVAIGAALAVVGLLATSFATALWECYLYFSVVVGFAHALAFAAPSWPRPGSRAAERGRRRHVRQWSGHRLPRPRRERGAARYDGGGNNDNNDNDNTNTGGAGDDGYDDRGWRAAFRLLALLSAVAIGGQRSSCAFPAGLGSSTAPAQATTTSRRRSTRIAGSQDDDNRQQE